MKYIVSSQEHGWSLLAFLKEKGKEAYSVKALKEAIASKSCRVGGRIETFPSRKLAEGEVVEFFSLEQETPKMEVLFQDVDFAVVNKSFGIVSSLSECKKYLRKEWSPVHRLDKDTSGLMLLAKNKKAEEAAKKLFSSRSIDKLYLAIVDGKLLSKKGVIDNFLGKKGGYQGQTLYGSCSEKEGARAITHYQLLSKGKDSSLALCDIKTGRTHQIRVHLSEMGHPVLGDSQYGKKGFTCPYNVKRQLLHAWKLRFTHPFTKKLVEVKAPIPKDFQEAIIKLELKVEGL